MEVRKSYRNLPTRKRKKGFDVTDLTEVNGHSDRSNVPRSRHRFTTRSKAKRRANGDNSEQKPLLTYPPNSGHRAVVSLLAADTDTLSQNQFLNDQVIDFWLQYIYRERLSESDRAKTHVFSSYFFNSLQMASSLSKTHQQSILKNWMKNVNIFEKEFVFVPISLRSHWFLAVLCFPYLNVDKHTIAELASEKMLKKVQLVPGESISGAKEVQIVLPKKPCILIFDSMTKYTKEHVMVFRTLWTFLTAEIGRQSNNSNVINFTAATMPGCVVGVPQQINKTDCGLYVLKYFECFFTDPIVSYEFPFEPRKKWFDKSVIGGMRQEIYKEIVRITKTFFPENLKDVPCIRYNSDGSVSDTDVEEEEEKEELRSDEMETEDETD